MSDRVYAIASLFENGALLPHFLDHYRRLGVDRIFVAVRSPAQGELWERALADASGYPADLYWFASRYFADSDKSDVEQSIIELNGVQPDDYIMHLDLDEFHEYPAKLSTIVTLMNQHDDWALRGWMTDRVAPGGTLEPIQPTLSIGKQYPIGCDLTQNVLQGWTQKIMLCRGRVKLQGGVNHDTWNAWYDRVPVGTPRDYIVHHFKWVQGVEERLSNRISHAAISGKYADECRSFLDHYRRHGRLDLENPRLNARYLGALPYYDELKHPMIEQPG